LRKNFLDFEKMGKFLDAIEVFKDTVRGTLWLLDGVTDSAHRGGRDSQFLIEHVVHLCIGYIAQCVRENRTEMGNELISRLITAVAGNILVDRWVMHAEHASVVKALVFDTAIGFMYGVSATTSDIDVWYKTASAEYFRVGHVQKGLRCAVRYGCLLSVRLGSLEKAVQILDRALAHHGPAKDVRIIARLNRAIITSMSGRVEVGISEIRQISNSIGSTCSNELKKLIEKFMP
jgi:hypothetical protein